jgi:site-specific DNA recombinase
MPKSLIYCRVSSDRQVREGHGLDGQEQRCRSYAAERGYEVAEVFRDEGVSGGTVEREGIQQLLDYLDVHGRRESYVVLIDDIKRLARDVVGHFQLRKAILSRKATLESPSHKFGDSPEEVFGECILAATAELERNQNRKQVYNRMKARLEAGYWPFYPPPGYVYAKVSGHGKLLVRSEPEASIINEALEGFAVGRFPTQIDVQAFLQSKGFNHRGTGRMTYLEQVKRLLTRELYAGFISYPPWQVTTRKGHHEPLIGGQTYERIKERLADRKKAPHRKDIRDDFPLRGFALCAECNKPYTSCWAKGRNVRFPYYLCKCPNCPVRNKSIRADRMHAEFDELLGRLRPRENIMVIAKTELLAQWQAKSRDVESVRKERKQKLDAIEKEIAEYVEAVKRCHNAIVIQTIEEKIEELKAKRLRLGGRIKRPKNGDYDFQTAVDRVFEFLKDPLFMWKTGDLGQKRLVLRLVFTEPLTYDRGRGFQTAPLSLPMAISCVPELDEMEVVDQIRKSSNRLMAFVRGWAEPLKGLQQAA